MRIIAVLAATFALLIVALPAKATVGPGGICSGVKIQKMMRTYNRSHRGSGFMVVSGSVWHNRSTKGTNAFIDIYAYNGGLVKRVSIRNQCAHEGEPGAAYPSWLPVSLEPYWP